MASIERSATDSLTDVLRMRDSAEEIFLQPVKLQHSAKKGYYFSVEKAKYLKSAQTSGQSGLGLRSLSSRDATTCTFFLQRPEARLSGFSLSRNRDCVFGFNAA